MSRSTVSRSRADKTKDRESKATTSSSVPQSNTDVIPGRFTEADWNLIVEKEDGEEFVVDIVSEVVDSAISVIYDNYIQKQLFPYVVDHSRQQFLHIIEWQFLARDGGEQNLLEDETWAEEEEPLPSTPDAWAQGSIPHRPLPPASPALSEHDTEVTSVSRISNPEILDDPPTTINGSVADTAETERSLEEELETGVLEEKEEENNNTQDVKVEAEKCENKGAGPIKPKKPKYKPHRGPLKSAGVRRMNQTLEDTEKEMMEAEQKLSRGPVMKSALDYMPSSCHNILKVQSGRPPGSKEVTYGDLGNVVAVLKLDPEKLPSHRVRTKFTVVDPAVEAAQARLQAMRTGRSYKAGLAGKQSRSQGTPRGKGQAAKTIELSPTAPSIRKREGAEERIAPLPPPPMESMDLSPRVTVREGGRHKQGPKPILKSSDVTAPGKIGTLQPLRILDDKGVPFSMADIISTRSPSVRPLTLNDPIPPIIPRHTPSRESTVEG